MRITLLAIALAALLAGCNAEPSSSADLTPQPPPAPTRVKIGRGGDLFVQSWQEPQNKGLAELFPQGARENLQKELNDRITVFLLDQQTNGAGRVWTEVQNPGPPASQPSTRSATDVIRADKLGQGLGDLEYTFSAELAQAPELTPARSATQPARKTVHVLFHFNFRAAGLLVTGQRIARPSAARTSWTQTFRYAAR